jgi:hypothetical protein
MPEISRFYGISVKMFHNHHAPPHFHAEYGGSEVLVEINTLSVFAGGLSRRATSLVLEWAADHQAELLQNWNLARAMLPLNAVDPLD